MSRLELEQFVLGQLKDLRLEMDQRAQDIAKGQFERLMLEKAKSDTILEGRANAFTVEVEHKI